MHVSAVGTTNIEKVTIHPKVAFKRGFTVIDKNVLSQFVHRVSTACNFSSSIISNNCK